MQGSENFSSVNEKGRLSLRSVTQALYLKKILYTKWENACSQTGYTGWGSWPALLSQRANKKIFSRGTKEVNLAITIRDFWNKVEEFSNILVWTKKEKVEELITPLWTFQKSYLIEPLSRCIPEDGGRIE